VPKVASNQSIKKSSFLHLLLLYLVLSYSAHLCCFEEKSIRVCLMRQGLTPFHASLHVSCELGQQYQDCRGDRREEAQDGDRSDGSRRCLH
jgi:hypothetical protein